MNTYKDKSLNHIFLYAKYWYKTELPHSQALRVLVAERSGMSPEFISNQDIYSVLMMCLEQIENKNWLKVLGDYFERFHCNSIRAMQWAGYNDNSDDARFGFILNQICHSKKEDIIFGLSAEDVDPNVQKALDDYCPNKGNEK